MMFEAMNGDLNDSCHQRQRRCSKRIYTGVTTNSNNSRRRQSRQTTRLQLYWIVIVLVAVMISITSTGIVVMVDGFSSKFNTKKTNKKQRPPGESKRITTDLNKNNNKKTITSTRSSPPSTVRITKQKTIQPRSKTIQLPESELINRRKSPALWRYDLTTTSPVNNGSTSSEDKNGKTSQHHQVKSTSSILLSSKPEVMSPVGGWEQLYAAIGNGADSIYLGLSSFSARARASNFDPYEELPKAVQTCHDANVRVYVALNTLVFDNELSEVEELIHACYKANVDALIVQDLGICRLIQEILQYHIDNDSNENGHRGAYQRMELHASTQQTVTSSDGVKFCAEQYPHCTRVVLGRELSVNEIQSVSKDMQKSKLFLSGDHDDDHDGDMTISSSPFVDVEIETFVHGALCVSYSGQCFSSEAWGGRSANRGQCAQACRLPYGLIDNGELKELGDFSYLLSPQDLCGLDHVPALIDAGVSCLKIEGRLKDPSYVAATTRAYRQAVDKAWEDKLRRESAQGGEEEDHGQPQQQHVPRILEMGDETISRNELVQLFSRGQDESNSGLTPGFLDGSHHQRLVRGRSPRHRGIHVGRVVEGSSWKNGLIIELDDTDDVDEAIDGLGNSKLKLGDGIVVDRGLAQEEELGGAIFDVIEMDSNRRAGGRRLVVRLSRDVERHWKEVDDRSSREHDMPPLAPVGAHIWKTSDAIVDKKMKRLAESPPPKTNMFVKVSGRIGEALKLELYDPTCEKKRIGIGRTPGELVAAERSGISLTSLQKAIGTLGNTPSWILSGEDRIDTSELQEDVWCPVSWIKEARRQAVEELLTISSPKQVDGNVDNVADVHEMPRILSGLMDQIRTEEHVPEISDKNIGKLSVLARNYEQVNAICEMIEADPEILNIVDEIYVDFLEVDGMKEAVDRVRAVSVPVDGNSESFRGIRVVVASPRIIKPGESGIWRTLLRLEPDALLVRSTGLLYRMMNLGGPKATIRLEKPKKAIADDDSATTNTETRVNESIEFQDVTIPELIGDFSLNVANALTAWELLQYGCSRVTASYDLRAVAITELLDSLGEGYASRVEIVSHAHLPIFHTEHCVFARFLSNGNSYLDCGHACTRHNVHLRDQTGADNLVLADMGCRNTVFSAQAQSGAHSIKEWKSAGAQRFRIELVDESAEDTQTIVRGYLDLLTGTSKPSELWETLENVRDSNGRKGGVSLGSFRNTFDRRAGEIS